MIINHPKRSRAASAHRLSLPLIGLLTLSAQAQAQAPTSEQSRQAQDEGMIVVTALIPRSHVDVLAGTSILNGEALTRALRPSLGETLAHQAGVSATSFGPTASRPILRGFSGDRIRLLTDGIGSFDVSATSVDHAVAINPMLADRIEVLHGPAALLYGASAVGGVVNVIDSRIPSRQPANGASGELDASYGSAAEERSLSGRADASLGGGFVAHIDGSYGKSADLRTGGYILAPSMRATALASPDANINALADLQHRLPNSAAESWNYAGSLAWLDGHGGSIGISLSQLHNLYGVPARYSLDPAIETEAPRIRMDQTRADLRATLAVNGRVIDEIRFRAGWADYRHDELEGDGAIGTSFFAKGLETRLEIVQTRQGGWDGAFGAQLMTRSVKIRGDEKFQPDNETDNIGLFTLQSFDLGDMRLEAGLRFEHAQIDAAADALLGNPNWQRKFDTVSGSLGFNYTIASNWRLGVNLSRSERAPTADELFARGNHAGTQAFELGNPDFGLERGWGAEALIHGSGTNYHLGLSAFYNRFSGFIYDHVAPDADCMAVNGGEPLAFPCFRFDAASVRYYGAEIEGDLALGTWAGARLKLDALADYSHATIIGGGAVPHIPPLRIMAGLSAETDRLNGRIEIEHDFAQNRFSTNETPTAAFTLVNASISWRPLAEARTLRLMLSANNLLDVVARRHASMLKDFAPLAGRDIRMTLSAAF